MLSAQVRPPRLGGTNASSTGSSRPVPGGHRAGALCTTAPPCTSRTQRHVLVRSAQPATEQDVSSPDAPAATRQAGWGAPAQLLSRAERTTRQITTSLEHTLLLGHSPSDMGAWDTARLAGTLMMLGLLQRTPSDAWLQQFYQASGPRLAGCSAEQLAMLTYGLSELQLQPPAAWTQRLLAAALAAVQPAAPTAAARRLRQEHPWPPGLKEGEGSSSSSSSSSGPIVVRLQAAAAQGNQPGAGGSHTSSGALAAGLMTRVSQWVGALQDGWRESRCSAELVTVLYNMSVAGLAMDLEWLHDMADALRPRLRHLNGEDLECLMACLADKGVSLSPTWTASCYARIDHINWTLQAKHLVGCLVALAEMGLQPPAPWLRRQLRQLQPALTLLPHAQLVQLAMVLPSLLSPQQAAAAAPWLQPWVSEYAAVSWERMGALDSPDLLYVLLGVDRMGCGAPDGWRAAIAAAVVERLPAVAPSQLAEMWQGLAAVEADDLKELRQHVADSLHLQPQQMSTSDVAPLLAALAASGRAPPAHVMDALLASSQDLLLGCHSDELVAMAASLAQLHHKPNRAWQAAFFAATRRRLSVMLPTKLSALLVACAALGLHPPEPWLRDHASASRRSMDELDGAQLAHLAWAMSCLTSDPGSAWLETFEVASAPRLAYIGPNQLAVVLKALATLHHRPCAAWQAAFFSAVGTKLFAVGAAALSFQFDDDSDSEEEAEADGDARLLVQQRDEGSGTSRVLSALSALTAQPDTPAASPAPSATSSTPLAPPQPSTPLRQHRSASPAAGSAAGVAAPACHLTSPAVTHDTINSLIYSLASLDLQPPKPWMDELMDAVRCKLSLMSTLDLSVVLAYLVARDTRPRDDWWDDFLDVLECRFSTLSSSEMVGVLVMLHALRVSPSAQWLDAFCAATIMRLSFFGPGHLTQVVSCLHLFRHRPSQQWMEAYTVAVEAALPRFSPTELARVLMLLDALNQRPSDGFMLRFYNVTRDGLAQLEIAELVNVSWAVVSCSMLLPDYRWVEALVGAARSRLAAMQPQQLRIFVSALGHMQRGVASPEADDCLAFAREFLV